MSAVGRVPRLMVPAVVAVPMLASLAAGLIRISRPQMWRDELATWTASTRSPGQLWHLLHHQDAVHGFYYLLMHFWIGLFGDSPLAVRLPSTLASAAAAGCLAVLGRRIGGDKLAVTAGLLYSLLPATARYAQEARSYAFMTLAVMLATLALVRAAEGDRRRDWTIYIGAVILVGAFNLVALTIVIGHLAYVARRSLSTRTLISMTASLSVAAIVLAPLIYVGSTQTSQLSWIPRPSLSNLVRVGPQLFASAIGAGAVLTLTAVAWSRQSQRQYPLVSMAVLPTIAIWLLSQGHTHYFLPRYLLFTIPFWALAAAFAIADARLWRILALLVALLVLVWPDQAAIRTATSHEAVIYSGAADIVARDARPGDAIVYARSDNTLADLGVRYYVQQHRHYYAPTDVWLGQRGAVSGRLLDRNTAHPSTDAISAFRRLWLVVPGNPADPLSGLTPAEQSSISSGFHIGDRHDYQRLTLVLLLRN